MPIFYRCLCITTASALPQLSTPVDLSHQASTSMPKRCNQPVKLLYVPACVWGGGGLTCCLRDDN